MTEDIPDSLVDALLPFQDAETDVPASDNAVTTSHGLRFFPSRANIYLPLDPDQLSMQPCVPSREYL